MTNILEAISARWKERRAQRLMRWTLFMGLSCIWWALTKETDSLCRVAGVLCIGGIVLEAWGCRRIPVLMFHCVSPRGRWLKRPFLVVPSDSFERQIRWLKDHGYRTLSLDELHETRQKRDFRGKLIALTFDDGYLDTWVVIAPLLKKYGLKGTSFIPTGWIADDGPPRTQTRMDAEFLKCKGYLNPSEIRLLKAEGVLDIQSHGVTHDRIFCDERITGFVTENNCPLWLFQLLHPEYRTSWYERKQRVPTGYPIFESGEALAVSAFHPDADFVNYLTEVACHFQTREGIASTNSEKKMKKELKNAVHRFVRSGGRLGRKETRAQTLDRWNKELTESRRVLEQITGQPVRHLCWPRDAYHKDSEQLAWNAGYCSVTSGRWHNGPENIRNVSRINISAMGWPLLDLIRFVLEIWVFNGHYWAWPALWVTQKIMLIILTFRMGNSH